MIVKKMGSRQKAVEAFLAVCDDGSPAIAKCNQVVGPLLQFVSINSEDPK
jgi:hypothetical protein